MIAAMSPAAHDGGRGGQRARTTLDTCIIYRGLKKSDSQGAPHGPLLKVPSLRFSS